MDAAIYVKADRFYTDCLKKSSLALIHKIATYETEQEYLYFSKC